MLPAAAYWPLTNMLGSKRSPKSDASQSPLASPSAAESHASRIVGAEVGASLAVDAVGGEPVRAGPVGVAVRVEGLFPEHVARVLDRRGDLRAVEPDGAVHAAVADEHDVSVAGVAARLLELRVRDAGAAFEVEDRL